MTETPSLCGDWLLLPEHAAAPVEGRSGAWRRAFRGGGRVLWWAPPKPGWVGAPWRHLVSAGSGGEPAETWLLGESPASDGQIADVVRDLAPASCHDPSCRLGGRFLLLVFRPRTETFEIITDRLGTLHAYAATGGRAVGTCFKAVATATSRDLDWGGLASFFALGFFLGERTFYRDVRCLGPARRHSIAPDGSTGDERYWRWRHHPEARRGYDETVHEFAEIFEGVVSETAHGRLALPISGGLDSRALVAALPAEGAAEVWSFAYGYQPGSVELRLARQVAGTRRLAFDAFVVEPYLADKIDLALDTVEGFQDVTQSRQLSVSETLASRADAVLAGHWGDVWLDDLGFGPRPGPGTGVLADRLFRKMAKRGRGWLLEHLCAPHLEADAETSLVREIARELDAYEHLEEADFRVKAFKTDHWSCRWTLASVRAYQAAAFPRLPFYDPRMVDFFATVPSSMLADRRLEIDYLRRRAPDLARVPWQETGADLFRSRRQAHWRGLPRRAAARAWRTLRRRPVIERNWEVQWLAPEGRSWLGERLLSPGLRLHDLVSPAAVGELVEDFFRHPTPATGYSISMLVTFAAWLERA